MPEREPANLESVLDTCPSLEFVIDGTERRINRPQAKADRKTYYSKKKAHSVKNLVIHDRKCKVRYLSDTYEGKKHDKAIADNEHLSFLEGSTLAGQEVSRLCSRRGDDSATEEDTAQPLADKH
ncbi:MAG: transposase family protein [Cyanobacteria bacterium P01_D01_bin.115]